MNCKKRYIPYLVAEALCLCAELVLFVLALLSGSIVAIAFAVVASAVCAGAVAWVTLKLLNTAPRRASSATTKTDKSSKVSFVADSGVKRVKAPRLNLKSFNGLRRKSMLLCLLIASMLSSSAAMLTVGALLLHTKFEIISLPNFASVLIGVGVFFAVGLVSLPLLCRSDKALARMLDARFGLQERVQTMMAYRAREEAIYALQRADTEAVIDRIPKRGVRIRHLWAYIVCLLLCAGVLVSSLMYTPVEPPEPPVEEIPFEITTIQIAAMEELIEYVTASEMESPYRESAVLSLTGLLEELRLATTESERDAAVGKSLKEIYNLTDASSSAVEIIEALWTSGSDRVKPLAEALNYYVWQDGTEWDEYAAALAVVRDGYRHSDEDNESAEDAAMAAAISEILLSDSSAISIALARSGIASDDAFHAALVSFAAADPTVNGAEHRGLSALAAAGLGYASLEGEIDSLFATVMPIFYTAIEQSEINTSTGEYAMTRVCYLFEHALPAFERPVLRDSSTQAGDGGTDDTEGGGMGGIGSGTVYGSDDLVLDPYTDEYVEYGTILDKYYSLMFGKTEDGDYTDEQIAALKKYFEILYGGFEDEE